ncbi:MAG TPA: hypothetical protein VE029_00365, partial [Rhizobacter sp.]|nr:hypothetical protein [Rhizobacter sp.]
MPFDPNPDFRASPARRSRSRWLSRGPGLLTVTAAVLLTHAALWHGVAASFEADARLPLAARSGLSLQTRTLLAVPTAAPMPKLAAAAIPLPVMAITSPAPARVKPLPVALPVQAEPAAAPRLPQ